MFSTQPSIRRSPESKRPVRETIAKPVIEEESEESDIEVIADVSVIEERRGETTATAGEEMKNVKEGESVTITMPTSVSQGVIHTGTVYDDTEEAMI